MTPLQAKKAAVTRWGRLALWRVAERLSSPEKRQAARDALDAARTERVAIDREIAERLQELAWYQELQAQRKAAVERARAALGETDYYKFTVGRRELGGFFIKGQGDTWEEAFAKADKSAVPRDQEEASHVA